MANPRSLIAVKSSRAGIFDAIIARDVTSGTDLAEVIVPAFDPEQVYAEAPWPTRGASLPAEGDRCVLVMAETDIPGTPAPWIACWWPS